MLKAIGARVAGSRAAGSLSVSLSWAAASLVFAATAAAQTAPYSVNDLVLGGTISPGSAAYRDYRCGPSEQFDGFVWCQKSRQGGMRRQSFSVAQSLLHSRDGRIAYINRQQDPVLFEGGDVDEDIRTFSRKLGAQPRITKMPRRGNLDGTLALWGQVSIEPLDADSVKILADGRSPRKGFLVDFLGNLTRSAQEGLPVYRITGGPGLIWVGSHDQRGRGTLRVTAVDASVLTPPVAATSPAPPSAESEPPTAEAQSPALAAESEPATPSPAASTPSGRVRAETAAVNDDDQAATPKAQAPVVTSDVQAQAKVEQVRFEEPATTATTAPTGAEAEIARLKSATRIAYSIVAGLIFALAAGLWLAWKRRARAREAAAVALAAERAKLGKLEAAMSAASFKAADGRPQPQDAKTIESGIFSIVQNTFDGSAATTGNGRGDGATPLPGSAPAAAAPLVPAGVEDAALSIVPGDPPERADAGAANPADSDPVSRLIELAKLHSSGLLTESEFAQLKASIMAAAALARAPSEGIPPQSAL